MLELAVFVQLIVGDSEGVRVSGGDGVGVSDNVGGVKEMTTGSENAFTLLSVRDESLMI